MEPQCSYAGEWLNRNKFKIKWDWYWLNFLTNVWIIITQLCILIKNFKFASQLLFGMNFRHLFFLSCRLVWKQIDLSLMIRQPLMFPVGEELKRRNQNLQKRYENRASKAKWLITWFKFEKTVINHLVQQP